MKAIWEKNYSVYGRRKMAKAVRRAGLDAGRDQVARLMREQGIRGASRAKNRFTTHADPTAMRAPDLVKRDFTASGPDQLWVADFTYYSSWSGVIYVAFVIDMHSRRIVGWKAARTMHASLVVDALNMAAWTRRGVSLAGLVAHSDAGSQDGINRSSQHLVDGGMYGDDEGTAARGPAVSRTGSLAWVPNGCVACRSGPVLGRGGSRSEDRGSCGVRRWRPMKWWK